MYHHLITMAHKLFTVRHLPTDTRFGYTRGNAVMSFREWQHAVSIKRLAYLAPLMQQQDQHIYHIPLQVPDYCILRPIHPKALTIEGHTLMQCQRYYALHNVNCLIVEHIYQDVTKDRLVFITYNPQDAHDTDYSTMHHIIPDPNPESDLDIYAKQSEANMHGFNKQKQISTQERIKQLNRIWHNSRTNERFRRFPSRPPYSSN